HAGYRTVPAGDFNGDGIPDWAYSKAGHDLRGVIAVVSGDTTLHVSSPPGHSSLLPESIKLLPPYPNPFNPEIVIPIEVSAPQVEVQLQIVNTLGQRVYSFPAVHLSAGSHRLKWEGRTSSGRLAASGRYFVRLMTSEGIQVQSIILQR
ncbi:MAG: FlgD immunoglobulin-like domain containing protein, partial [bacterium]